MGTFRLHVTFSLYKATKQNIGKAIGVGDGNVAAFFKTGQGSMELVRLGDGQTIQNLEFFGNTYVYDADYKNKVIIVLDSQGKVATASYEPDE
jgi:hypothetical protein